MKPKIKITNKLECRKEIDGTFTYYEGDCADCQIIINKNSKDPSQALIHESIHASLAKMETIPEVEKLAHRMNRREDFVYILSVQLSKVLNFCLEKKK